MSTRAELEAAILADPDARDAYAVYADWLLEHGDPDGELIAVQLALEDAPGDAKLKERERKLLDVKEDQLRRLFYVGVHRAIRHPIWRRGVLHSIEVRGAEDGAVTATAYTKLLADPCSRFLRELTVRSENVQRGRRTPATSAIVDAIAASGAPRGLRRLAFYPVNTSISDTWLSDLSPIYPHLPGLEELVIHAGDVTLGEIDLPSLRTFELEAHDPYPHVPSNLATAAWPRLERLVLDIGNPRNRHLTPQDLFPLLDSPSPPPGLRTLGLLNCAFADLIPVLARSRLLPGLQHLDLSRGTLDEAGARTLLTHADAFRHLATLSLRSTYFPPAIYEALTQLGPRVELNRF